jgi:hypothetical protein
MNKWIKVEEQLPPLGECVLVWLDEDDRPDVDRLEQLSPSDGGGVQLVNWYLHNITHWQSIDRPEQAAGEASE